MTPGLLLLLAAGLPAPAAEPAPDPRRGLYAIWLRPGQSASAEELTAYCKERLAAYKYPRNFEFMEALPKGPTGKILKRELRPTQSSA